MKKTISLMLIVILVLTGTFFVSSVSANFTPLPELPTPIYIRSNGAVEGGGGAIKQTGNTYTFVRDINETIKIQKDNIILDGNGFSLTKPPKVKTEELMTPIGWFPSINISYCDNVIIRNIKFDKCYTCISVENSTNVVIIQNIMRNADLGIFMTSCNHCNVIGNEIVDNAHSALNIMYSSYLNIAYNTISRNHFHGGWVSTSYSNISRNNITDNSFSHFGIGLYLYGPNSNNRFFENNFINNEHGLFYQGSRGISVNNKVYSNYWSNYEDDIVNVAADEASGVDQTPLESPISTSFDPALFPSFASVPTASPSEEVSELTAQQDYTAIIVVALAVISASSLAILIRYKSKRKSKL